jgi:hypothetical protein
VSSTGIDGALDCPECGAVCALRLGVCQVCYAEVHERDGDWVGPALTDASILDVLFEPETRRRPA